MSLTPIQQIAIAGLIKNTADRVNDAAASLAKIEEQNKQTLTRIEQQNREIQSKPPESISESYDSKFDEAEYLKIKKERAELERIKANMPIHPYRR